MEFSSYAPVIIPTVNRYEHFQRCLESLERCTGADKTDVYVALDYPPSEKYVEGWKKIDEYLHEKEKENGFKSLVVYRREENYYHTKGNIRTAVKDLPKNVDRYITSEDDNEFSPCFLEYMNQNLEKYKNDDSIIRVCGHLPLSCVFDTEYSQFVSNWYNAWGTGHWVSKEKDLDLYRKPAGMKTLYNSSKVRRYYESTKLESMLVSLVSMSKKKCGLLGDVIVAAYMVYKDKWCILPTKSMVRNHGWDGSGQHGGYVYGYKEQEIQLNADYMMNEAPDSFTKNFVEERLSRKKNKKRDLNNISNAISWYMYKFFGIFCEFKAFRKMAKKHRKMILFSIIYPQ